MYKDIRATVVGSINMDLILNMKKVPDVGENVLGTDYGYANGGKGANQATALAKLGAKVKMIGKAMGAKKAYGQLNSIVKSKNVDFDMPFGVLWSGTDSTIADKYIKDSKDIFPDGLKEIPIRTMGSTIGTHVGPGAIGIAFFEK